MKELFIIYNPSAGRQWEQDKVFEIARQVQLRTDWIVSLYATKGPRDAERMASTMMERDVEIVMAAGGDGTIHEVINGLMKHEKRPRLAILPAGTVNDFARQLKLPNSVGDVVDMLVAEQVQIVDVGQVNERFFINVAAGGAFTSIAHEMASEWKTWFGRLAYYVQGAVKVPEEISKSYLLTFETPENTFTVDTLLFLVSNTASVGGFSRALPDASYQDGKFDCLVIEQAPIPELMEIFTRFLMGIHVQHDRVHHFQTQDLIINGLSNVPIDVDGERGDLLPVQFHMEPGAIEVIVVPEDF
jgi:diacylglycerol kinase (ATP)